MNDLRTTPSRPHGRKRGRRQPAASRPGPHFSGGISTLEAGAALCAVCLTYLLLSWTADAIASPAPRWQPVESIRTAARDFLAGQPGNDARGVTVVAGELDPRLRLSRCGAPLSAFLPPGANGSGNTSVGVKCTTPKPWKLFVPVRVSRVGPVVVAAQPLPRGLPVDPGHLNVVERDLNGLTAGYISDPALIVGKVLTRTVPAGAVVTPTAVRTARTIRRGQSVTLQATGGALRIRATGKALADAGTGERVAVRNLSSGRVVEGVVRSSELVEIGIN